MLKKKKVNVKPINHQEFGKMSYNIPVEVEKNNKVNEKEVFNKRSNLKPTQSQNQNQKKKKSPPRISKV
jgi:hypothetical protein